MTLALLMVSQMTFATPVTDANLKADAALSTLMTRFWDNNKKTFTIGGGYWYYAQALDAAVMAEGRQATKANKDRVDLLFKSQKDRGFIQKKGATYYDDENWMAMALIRAYSIRKNPEFLSSAIELFNDIASAEIFDAKGNSKGVWWDDRHTQIATAANMGVVNTAAMLYRVTKNPKYLAFAERVYKYWYNNMVIHETWQVIDHMDPQGKKEAVPLTYNQGLAVGAALLLYKATGNFSYLNHAEGYADFVVKKMTNNGVMVEKVCDGRVLECRKNKDLVQFKGITYRYLVKLAVERPDNKDLVNMLNKTADALWNRARDPKSGLFAHEWDGQDHEPFNTFSSSASAALALGGHARLMLRVCEYL